MKLEVSAISDVGNVRARNEDMILIKDEWIRNGGHDCTLDFDDATPPFLLAIADGMGGHKGGAFASEIVLREMAFAVLDIPLALSMPDLKTILKEKILAIHDKLNTEGMEPEKKGMGSTFTGLLFYGSCLFLINIGDSRIYRFRKGILSMLTRDHSYSAMTHNPEAPKNLLINSFGAGANIFFDFEDLTTRLLPGDTLLLCSDGLTNELTDDEIETILSQTPCAAPLVTAALNNRGMDNVSVIVATYSK